MHQSFPQSETLDLVAATWKRPSNQDVLPPVDSFGCACETAQLLGESSCTCDAGTRDLTNDQGLQSGLPSAAGNFGAAQSWAFDAPPTDDPDGGGGGGGGVDLDELIDALEAECAAQAESRSANTGTTVVCFPAIGSPTGCACQEMEELIVIGEPPDSGGPNPGPVPEGVPTPPRGLPPVSPPPTIDNFPPPLCTVCDWQDCLVACERACPNGSWSIAATAQRTVSVFVDFWTNPDPGIVLNYDWDLDPGMRIGDRPDLQAAITVDSLECTALCKCMTLEWEDFQGMQHGKPDLVDSDIVVKCACKSAA